MFVCLRIRTILDFATHRFGTSETRERGGHGAETSIVNDIHYLLVKESRSERRGTPTPSAPLPDSVTVPYQ